MSTKGNTTAGLRTARGNANREALKRRVLGLLRAAGRPMTVGEVADAAYPSVLGQNVVRQAVADLVDSGEVVRRPHPTVITPGASVYAAAGGGAP